MMHFIPDTNCRSIQLIKGDLLWKLKQQIYRCRSGLFWYGGRRYRPGTLFGQFFDGALRNPAAADGQFRNLLIGFALTEALGIFSLLVASSVAVRCLILL